MYHYEPSLLPAFHFDADPDPAFHIDPDRIRLRFPKMRRILADPDPQTELRSTPETPESHGL
jgi:hypothetical protein